MKKLVVFYSYTGHTKMIAENIQQKLNCDILEIKPVKPYSTDYQTVVDEEQNNSSVGKTPDIQKIDKNLNDYDEIIIGTPVWLYTIAPVIRTFLTQNDLSNKTIKPLIVTLTIPITAISLGIFYPFINVFILKIVDFIMGKHFSIHGIFMSFLVAILISLMNIMMDKLVLEPLLGKE